MNSRICPRCEAPYVGWPALSRRDNRTDICPGCVSEEAMIDAGLVKPGTREADILLARDRRFTERVSKKEEER